MICGAKFTVNVLTGDFYGFIKALRGLSPAIADEAIDHNSLWDSDDPDSDRMVYIQVARLEEIMLLLNLIDEQEKALYISFCCVYVDVNNGLGISSRAGIGIFGYGDKDETFGEIDINVKALTDSKDKAITEAIRVLEEVQR